jgi:hypothetical protein
MEEKQLQIDLVLYLDYFILFIFFKSQRMKMLLNRVLYIIAILGTLNCFGLKKIGVSIIVDGFRRIFNGLEEQSVINEGLQINFENENMIPQLGIVKLQR